MITSVLQRLLAPVLVLALSASLHAAPSDAPLQLVERATNRILTLSIEARDYADQDPERYYRQVSEVLDEVIDFDGFARGVMATYASARLYKSLETDAERDQFNERVRRFGDKIERALIVTYADAVLSFNGERISVSVPPGGEPADHRAMVNQEIYSSTGKVYLVQYSLRESRDAGWQVNNVTVDGANLGQMYRTQFATLVEQAKGDVDVAIDNWGKRDGQ